MLIPKKKEWIEIVLHVAFWIGVFYTLLSLSEAHIKMRINNNGTVLEKDVRHTLSPHIFLTLGFMIVLFYGNIFWLFKKALRYKNILIRVVLPVVWFATIFMANNYLDTLLPKQKKNDPILEMSPPPPPIVKLRTIDTSAIDPVKIVAGPHDIIRKGVELRQSTAFVFAQNGLSNTILFIFIIVFGLSLAYFFLKEWARSELLHNQLQAHQLNTEVKFLKSQINPHFLFNTLNNLFSMAQGKGNDELADGISKLSGMMRYMIYESNEENVPLKKEIEYLQNCVVLNKLRYADEEVKVIFDYPDKTEGIFVAPMLFIPFVENAFKHGVSIGQSSQIDIAISLTGKQLNFSCENMSYSYIKKMPDEKSGIGLENVKRRLELVYPGKHTLIIHDEDGKYNVKLEIDLG
jgi:two-component system LytT family sensor kinase